MRSGGSSDLPPTASSSGTRQIRTSTAWLAPVLGIMQTTAAPALLLTGTASEVLVDPKKKLPEAGMANQIMIHIGVLRGCGKPCGVRPWENSIK
jgi:hypothetical protein